MIEEELTQNIIDKMIAEHIGSQNISKDVEKSSKKEPIKLDNFWNSVGKTSSSSKIEISSQKNVFRENQTNESKEIKQPSENVKNVRIPTRENLLNSNTVAFCKSEKTFRHTSEKNHMIAEKSSNIVKNASIVQRKTCIAVEETPSCSKTKITSKSDGGFHQQIPFDQNSMERKKNGCNGTIIPKRACSSNNARISKKPKIESKPQTEENQPKIDLPKIAERVEISLGPKSILKKRNTSDNKRMKKNVTFDIIEEDILLTVNQYNKEISHFFNLDDDELVYACKRIDLYRGNNFYEDLSEEIYLIEFYTKEMIETCGYKFDELNTTSFNDVRNNFVEYINQFASQDANENKKNEEEKVKVIEINEHEGNRKDELISSSVKQLDLSVDNYDEVAMEIDEELTNNYIANDSDDDCVITGTYINSN